MNRPESPKKNKRPRPSQLSPFQYRWRCLWTFGFQNRQSLGKSSGRHLAEVWISVLFIISIGLNWTISIWIMLNLFKTMALGKTLTNLQVFFGSTDPLVRWIVSSWECDSHNMWLEPFRCSLPLLRLTQRWDKVEKAFETLQHLPPCQVALKTLRAVHNTAWSSAGCTTLF